MFFNQKKKVWDLNVAHRWMMSCGWHPLLGEKHLALNSWFNWRWWDKLYEFFWYHSRSYCRTCWNCFYFCRKCFCFCRSYLQLNWSCYSFCRSCLQLPLELFQLLQKLLQLSLEPFLVFLAKFSLLENIFDEVLEI